MVSSSFKPSDSPSWIFTILRLFLIHSSKFSSILGIRNSGMLDNSDALFVRPRCLITGRRFLSKFQVPYNKFEGFYATSLSKPHGHEFSPFLLSRSLFRWLIYYYYPTRPTGLSWCYLVFVVFGLSTALVLALDPSSRRSE